MQLSKFTDYSFRALIYLADKKGSLATVEELANALQISEHHLKKIIHKLAKTNYVISIKGRGGGLKLGMDPKDINLGEILKITEDNLNIVYNKLKNSTKEEIKNLLEKLIILLRDALESAINKEEIIRRITFLNDIKKRLDYNVNINMFVDKIIVNW